MLDYYNIRPVLNVARKGNTMEKNSSENLRGKLFTINVHHDKKV